MGFYVYRKFYVPQAKNMYEAFDFLRQAEEKGVEKNLLMSQWAREDKEETGWLAGIKRQLRGRK